MGYIITIVGLLVYSYFLYNMGWADGYRAGMQKDYEDRHGDSQ